MDFFKTPGIGLMGTDRTQFDEIKALIDNGTNELLLNPDWDTNIRIVDSVNACANQTTVNEVVFLIKRKLSSSHPKSVALTLTIVEALVKNCGHRVYMAVNQDSFMKEMGKVARKYNSKSGADYAEVASLSLDIIQAWGEAFLPIQNRYPNITRLYQDLRKERLPFSNQYDKARVPIFTSGEPDSPTPRRYSQSSASSSSSSYPPNMSSTGNMADDELLAAVMAASLADVPRESRSSSMSVDTRRSSSSMSSSTQPAPSKSPKNELLGSITTSTTILRDMILAATSAREIISDTIASEIYNQLTFLQSRLAGMIESELINNPEGLEQLFKANDDAQTCSSTYEKLRKGSTDLKQAQAVLKSTIPAASEPVPSSSTSTAATSNNLLDFDISPTTPSSTPNPIQSKPASSSGDNMMYSSPASVKQAPGPSSSSKSKALPLPQPLSNQASIRRQSKDAPIIAQTTTTSLLDDPFGPSSSSSIDALLSEPAAKPAAYDPFAMPSSSSKSAMPVASSYSKPVDPLDGLLAIASRSDDFSMMSSPPPVPVAQAYPMGSGPMQPPRFESNIPPHYAQGISPMMPGQGMPSYPGNFPPGPAQPGPWPQQPMMPTQPGAPPPYWQVGQQPQQQQFPPQPQSYPMPGFAPPPAPPAQPKPSDESNPFDLF